MTSGSGWTSIRIRSADYHVQRASRRACGRNAVLHKSSYEHHGGHRGRVPACIVQGCVEVANILELPEADDRKELLVL